ncbi:ferritin-like domain-containing protein [Acuticoccus sp.]|uniref:ferritin-like domain-containing protein n=1 Tax=Acuticoccus sp. TaxID=1904378 RepID=UPI003B529A8B
MAMTATVDRERPAFDVFVTGLKNTHGLEKQGLSILDNQIERLERYPELHAALRRHRDETQAQAERLEALMSQYGESASSFKEGVMGLVGQIPTLTHAAAEDEVLKNLFAGYGFENYEVASYDSLLVMAEAAGHSDTSPLQTSLREEEEMVRTLRPMVSDVTRKYVSLETAGANASR